MWGWPAPCGAGLVVTADTIPFRLKKAEQMGAGLIIICFEGFISLALKCVERGGIVPVEKTVTHRLGMEEAPKGFQAVCSPMEHNCIKVIVEPQK